MTRLLAHFHGQGSQLRAGQQYRNEVSVAELRGDRGRQA